MVGCRFSNIKRIGVYCVNRGSLGYGQDNAQSLMGKIGTNDVADCVQGVEECLQNMPQGMP